MTNERTLESFLASIERRAYKMALLALRDRDEALDAVQDAMCKLAQHYAARPSAEWPALLHTILQSRITDCHRRRRVRQGFFGWFPRKEDEGEEEPAEQRWPDPAPTPPEQVRNADAVAALEQALAELPERQRQTVLLRVWEGLDVAATAQVMGCGEGSVKTHLSRALATLREKLGEHWP